MLRPDKFCLRKETVMIIAKSVEYDHVGKKATGSFFADTKSEVLPNATIKGLPEGYTVGVSSSMMTAAGELAFMKSDGNWNWT